VGNGLASVPLRLRPCKHSGPVLGPASVKSRFRGAVLLLVVVATWLKYTFCNFSCKGPSSFVVSQRFLHLASSSAHHSLVCYCVVCLLSELPLHDRHSVQSDHAETWLRLWRRAYWARWPTQGNMVEIGQMWSGERKRTGKECVRNDPTSQGDHWWATTSAHTGAYTEIRNYFTCQEGIG